MGVWAMGRSVKEIEGLTSEWVGGQSFQNWVDNIIPKQNFELSPGSPLMLPQAPSYWIPGSQGIVSYRGPHESNTRYSEQPFRLGQHGQLLDNNYIYVVVSHPTIGGHKNPV